MADPREIIPRPMEQEHFLQTDGGIRYPVTKDEATVGAYEAIDKDIIDEFIYQDWFFANIPLRECVDAVNGGGASVYKFWRYTDLTSATFRRYNEDVSETKTHKESYTANIGNLASAFSMDVELMSLGSIEDAWEEGKYRAAQGMARLFNDTVIRGDVSAAPVPGNPELGIPADPTKGTDAFDGLDVIIRKDSLHVWDEALDLTGLGGTYGQVTTNGALKGVNKDDGTGDATALQNAKALTTKKTATAGLDTATPFVSDFALQNNVWYDVIDQLMGRIRKLRPAPTFILGNDDLISAMSILANRTGTWSQKSDDWGHTVDTIRGIQLISMGRRANQYEKEIIPTEKIKIDNLNDWGLPKPRYSYGDDYVYKTTAYLGSFGATAIQGLTLPGNLIKVREPESMDRGEWVKKWRVSMHLGMAVKTRNACGMFVNIYLPKTVIERPNYVDEAILAA